MKNTHLFYGKGLEEILEIENYFNFFYNCILIYVLQTFYIY